MPTPLLPAALTTTATAASAEQLAWLALTLTPGLGPQRIKRAFQIKKQLDRVFSMALTELEGLGFPAEAAHFVFEGNAERAAEKEWAAVAEAGAEILVYSDSDYPEQLRNIFDPPPVLWLRGNRKLLARPGIAVVGTRRPSPYGLGMSEMLSRDLAARRLVILSGMARGIDTAAHKGALAAGGKTIAVWGTGVDVIYPKENKALAEDILRGGGAILSELPLGTFPAPQNFPNRNRILSGMSVGVLVIEAAENSGTRITARCAMEQNRDVYAVPGNVTNKGSWGPNTLIKQGARLTATWEDVWEDLPSQVRLQLEDEAALATQGVESKGGAAASTGSATLFAMTPFAVPPMREQESVVYLELRHDEPTQVDGLMELLEGRLSSAEIFTALFELEIAGHIRQMPGKNYVRRM
jgi:DNA processing protein